MRKTLLISFALLLAYALTGIASEKQSICGQMLGKNDTLIYLPGDSSETPMILHKERCCITMSPYSPATSSPDNQGTVLDVPVNDDCANATAIGEVDHLPASTLEASVDGGDFTNFPNIWYLYTPSETGRYRAFIGLDEGDTQASGGRITVYDGNTCPEPAGIPESSPLQGGETIETAVPIGNQLPVSIQGNLTGYTRDYHDFSCGVEHNDLGPDAVYSYTAESDGQINIFLSQFQSELNLIVMDEDGYEIACCNEPIYENINENVNGPAIFNLPVVAGETYYLIASGIQCDFGYSYKISIFEPNYEIIGKGYLYLYTGTYVDFYGIAGQEYLIEIGYRFPSSTTFLTIAPLPDPPVNDICENAQDGGVLEPGSTIQFTGDNTGATKTNPLDWPYPDIWIKFSNEDTLTVLMDYCGNTSLEGMLLQAGILTQYCPHHSYGWYVAESQMYTPNCPNSTFLIWWENLPPGTYYYPMLIHDSFEGFYAINITGVGKQECNEESAFGQNPSNILTYDHELFPSDIEIGYASTDKITNVTDDIVRVTWWGFNLDPSGQIIQNCDPEDPCPFQIIFQNLNQDMPYFPGDTAAIYEVIPEIIETGIKANAYLDDEISQRKYSAELNPPMHMEDGWITIRGNDGINNCIFAWQNSKINWGNALRYDDIEDNWTRVNNSFAFCLDDGLNAIDDETEILPSDYELIQNYPNPFNATTSIRFTLKQSDNITLSVYDIGGRMIKTLYNGSLSAGLHSLTWDGTDESGETVASGIYFYRLQTTEETFNNSMVLLK